MPIKKHILGITNMAKKNNLGWRPVQLPKDLVDEVEKIIKKDTIKKQGITSISQFIARTINDAIEAFEKTGFATITIKDKQIEIFDTNIGNKGTLVKIHHDKDKLNCSNCNSNDCPHINYIWSIEHIADELEGKGLIRTEKTCPKCGTMVKRSEIADVFGYRKINNKIITQSYCKECRNKSKK